MQAPLLSWKYELLCFSGKNSACFHSPTFLKVLFLYLKSVAYEEGWGVDQGDIYLFELGKHEQFRS